VTSPHVGQKTPPPSIRAPDAPQAGHVVVFALAIHCDMSGASSSSSCSCSATERQYLRLRAVILDGHNDLALRVWQGLPPKHVLLESAGEVDFGGGWFAMSAIAGMPNLPTKVPYEVPLDNSVPFERAVQQVGEQLATLEGLDVSIVRVVDDIVPGRVNAIVHFEGAEPIAPDLSNLEDWYARGLRSLGIVWSRPNAFGEGVPFRFPASPDTGAGLTQAGRDLVHACDFLGIMVDVSHLNEKGFWDVAGLTDAPVVATHSNPHALCPVTRNLTDEQLDAIAESGGIVGINFAVAFLRSDGRNDTDTPIAEIVRHVDYVASRIGVEHVAFGSDFDGADVPEELGSIRGLPRLVEGLRAIGYDDEALALITHRNWLRVLDATWNPWARYFRVAGDDPRGTLVDAAGRFASPGFAVDLGAGTGRDTAELLRRGWRVLAIDGQGEAVARLRALGGDLEVVQSRFEDVTWPECDLVNASFALPFCPGPRFPEVWRRIVDSLVPGGRFAGQLFGVNDEWARTGLVVQTRAEVEELLAPFEIEHLEEVDREGKTATGETKHWHLFHVVARKR
jgi:membrane dipeptidase